MTLKIGTTDLSSHNDLEYNFQHNVKVISHSKEVKDLDLVIFPGGADVNPNLYGEENRMSFIDNFRDSWEIEVFNECIDNNIKIFGICRGNQFINVMCGGKLYQHIDGHAGRIHGLCVINESNSAINSLKYSKQHSTHHQAVKELGKDVEILAYDSSGKIIEATKRGNSILTVQFHPEYKNNFEFFNLVKDWCYV